MKKSLSLWALVAAMTLGTADTGQAQESRRALMRQKLENTPAEQRAAFRMKRAETRAAKVESRKARVREKVSDKAQEVSDGEATEQAPARGRHEGFARKKAKRRAEHLRQQKKNSTPSPEKS